MRGRVSMFRGNYSFLSNFYTCRVEYNGLVFSNSEAAFQSAKCVNEEDRKGFCNLGPKQAKHLGRLVDLRYDWEQVKLQIMLDVLMCKFRQNKHLMDKLVDTGDSYLEEGNVWNDKYWGVCRGVGSNYLGKLLMLVRRNEINRRKESNGSV